MSGTLVKFEMVRVPGTTIWIGRTEVTWDLYDAFAQSRPDTVERRAGVDADHGNSREGRETEGAVIDAYIAEDSW